MKFSLLVMASPGSGECADSAWRFARAVVDGGHELHRVFFFHEGAYNGAALAVPAQDEADRTNRWVDLARDSGTDLVLCIASAARRGVLDATEARRHEQSATSAHPAFTLSGLGQLIDASAHSDRLVTFG